METASDPAPAAQRSLEPGADTRELLSLSLREAARRSDPPHDVKALRQAIEAGVLRAGWIDGTRRQRQIAESELRRFLQALGACQVPGCDRPARYPSFACSKAHAVSLARTDAVSFRQCETCGKWFRPRPEQLAIGMGFGCSRKCGMEASWARRVAEGKVERKGRLVECACGCGESRVVYPSQGYRFQNSAHWARYRWKHGIALVSSLRGFYRAGHISLATLRTLIGRTGGAPKLADVDPDFADKAAKVVRLHQANPRLGGRVLAERTGLSHRQVRQLLGRLSAS
jgi:hypothetical protein